MNLLTDVIIAWFAAIVVVVVVNHLTHRGAAIGEEAARSRGLHPDLLAIVAATSEPPCECRWWDSDGDRCEWIPCGEHAELLARDVLK